MPPETAICHPLLRPLAREAMVWRSFSYPRPSYDFSEDNEPMGKLARLLISNMKYDRFLVRLPLF